MTPRCVPLPFFPSKRKLTKKADRENYTRDHASSKTKNKFWATAVMDAGCSSIITTSFQHVTVVSRGSHPSALVRSLCLPDAQLPWAEYKENMKPKKRLFLASGGRRWGAFGGGANGPLEAVPPFVANMPPREVQYNHFLIEAINQRALDLLKNRVS